MIVWLKSYINIWSRFGILGIKHIQRSYFVCSACWIQDGLLHKFLHQFLTYILQVFSKKQYHWCISLVLQKEWLQNLSNVYKNLQLFHKQWILCCLLYSCEWCTCWMFALSLLQHMSNVLLNIWPDFYCSLSYLFIFHPSSSTEFKWENSASSNCCDVLSSCWGIMKQVSQCYQETIYFPISRLAICAESSMYNMQTTAAYIQKPW